MTLDVLWGGICGTDLHEYLHGPFTINKPEKPHGITGDHLPLAFGHEFVGRVSAVAEGYDGPLQLGTPVCVDPRIICRKEDSSILCSL